MHSLRALQGAQLGRSLAGIVDIAQYGHCLSCSRWFSQEPKPNGQGIDPKTSSSSESTTATAMKGAVQKFQTFPSSLWISNADLVYTALFADTLTKENERKAAESAAQSVTAAMFPWERRQMDGEGTPLNRFERVYWIAFAGAAAFIAGSNIYRYFTVKKEVVVFPEPA